MKRKIALSPAQAGALARLIRMQMNAYEEAGCGEATPLKRAASESAPVSFSAADLDLVEPLVVLLEKNTTMEELPNFSLHTRH